jgi:hypothetical protein
MPQDRPHHEFIEIVINLLNDGHNLHRRQPNEVRYVI